MITKLRIHLTEHFPFLTHKRLLLAVSGGLDSMALAHLFLKLPFEIGIAHCNFTLRGEESDADEAFVKSFAETHHIPFFQTRFDTASFAKDFKLSTQLAARELRYNWFREILEQDKFDYVVTAHHADDNLETFLINFSRGTGPEGLTGIPAINGQIIRPLLPFSRDEIQTYARQNELAWREDSSNTSDKYLRNKLRQHVIPLLKEINPSLLQSFAHTASYLQQSLSMADDASRIVYRKVVTAEPLQKKINLNELLVLPNYKAYLHSWLAPLGFTAWEDIYHLVNAQTGKQVFCAGYRLLKDREFLLLAPNSAVDAAEIAIERNTSQVNFPLKLSFCKVNDISDAPNTIIFVDEDLLHFPLILRKWREGDDFQPFGMHGKSKKVSKFFKDEKRSAFEKEQTWLLCSGDEIVWIVGLRQDERFKIQHTTQNILQITLHDTSISP
ncbi:tRNA lysidine(34) synthetase TilS [Flavobacterium magnum]|uniref:tRNA(Ile)-lysidine synthase n=1 Tax=Flavobacterium magnum TaxID=2162713 RepID=A0A2S0RFL8_9FLAO|nr:tRNA lysidine(34) synthetase TilS [Flavobacterium magnum]AWA30456.1 tRNA lysidine(34) synthetase TilS [Flavobacterium magnum]